MAGSNVNWEGMQRPWFDWVMFYCTSGYGWLRPLCRARSVCLLLSHAGNPLLHFTLSQWPLKFDVWIVVALIDIGVSSKSQQLVSQDLRHWSSIISNCSEKKSFPFSSSGLQIKLSWCKTLHDAATGIQSIFESAAGVLVKRRTS